MVTISTRVRRHAQVLAIAERFPDVTCSVGTHPHHAHEELDITAEDLIARAASEGRRDRRGRARLSLRQLAARRAGAGLPHPHRGGARHAAAGDPFARSRRRHRAHPGGRKGEGRLPGRAALLHRRRRAGAPRRRARLLYRLHRHRDVQEFRPRCARSPGASGGPLSGRDRRAVSGAAAVSRQAQRAVLRGRGRQGAGRGARRFVRGNRAPDHGEFLQIVREKSLGAGVRRRPPHEPDVHDSRLRLVRRRAAPRHRLGRVRPEQSERTAAAAARCWSSAAEAATSPASWSTPGRICATS